MTRKSYPDFHLKSRFKLSKCIKALDSRLTLFLFSTKSMFINDVHAFISEATPGNQVPFSDRYFVTNETIGSYDAYEARPVVGGHFAVLALGGANTIGG